MKLIAKKRNVVIKDEKGKDLNIVVYDYALVVEIGDKTLRVPVKPVFKESKKIMSLIAIVEE